jgi:uncharacterized phage protein (TIGR02218 family)
MSYDSLEKSRNDGNPVELFRFSMGSTVWRYTSADRRIYASVGGDGLQLYEPEPMERDESDYSQEDQSGTLQVLLSRFNPVAHLFMAQSPPQPVALTIYRLHYTDGATAVTFIGKVSSVVYEGPTAALRCSPLSAAMNRNIPRLLQQKHCNWALYGPGCGLNKESFKDTGTVASVSGFMVTADVFATRADGWFDTGWMELADGTRRYITAHVGNTVTLQDPFLSLPNGTAFSAFAGCLRTEAVCASKFSNLVNFLGFERIPSRNPYELGMS